jgi:hypothetical protein
MIGAGGHTVWVDPRRDLVMAARWVKTEGVDLLIALVARTIDARTP